MSQMIIDDAAFRLAYSLGEDFSSETKFIRQLFDDVKTETSFGLIDYRGVMDDRFVSESFLLSKQLTKRFQKEGYLPLYFVSITEHGSLRDLQNSMSCIANLSSAGLIESLSFLLCLDPSGKIIFAANQDNTHNIPSELSSDVLNAILSINPSMNKEKLLDSVRVTIKAHIPCLSLSPIGADIEGTDPDYIFLSRKGRYSCQVVDGYSFSFSGLTVPYQID